MKFFVKHKEYLSYLGLFLICFLLGFMLRIHSNSVVNAVHVAQVESSPITTTTPKVAIVIDDFGYNGQGSHEMLNLPIPITVAIMPFSSHSKETGEQAQILNQEVIVHMPMESLTGKPEWVGDKGIFRSMSDEEIVTTTKEALEILPMAIGMNNHMGSAIMEDERSLRAVMEVVAENNMIFLDSVTTGASVGQKLAQEKDVVFLKRDIFLDSTNSQDVVEENMLKAMNLAKEKGQAIAIGHVGVEGGNITVEAIKNYIPIYEENGVEFVFLSQLSR